MKAEWVLKNLGTPRMKQEFKLFSKDKGKVAGGVLLSAELIDQNGIQVAGPIMDRMKKYLEYKEGKEKVEKEKERVEKVN